MKVFKLIFTSLKLCKILLSSIDVIRELLLFLFSINLSLSVKSQNGFSNSHNSPIAISIYMQTFLTQHTFLDVYIDDRFCI